MVARFFLRQLASTLPKRSALYIAPLAILPYQRRVDCFLSNIRVGLFLIGVLVTILLTVVLGAALS